MRGRRGKEAGGLWSMTEEPRGESPRVLPAPASSRRQPASHWGGPCAPPGERGVLLASGRSTGQLLEPGVGAPGLLPPGARGGETPFPLQTAAQEGSLP